MYNPSLISWLLWAASLVVAATCLWPERGISGIAQWVNPKSAFGFAFGLFHVVRPVYLLVTGDFYGTRLGFYGFASPDEMNPMLAASVLGGICFLVGWHWGKKPFPRFIRPRKIRSSSHEVGPQPSLLGRVLVLAPFALMAFVFGARGDVSLEAINIYYLLRSSLIAITYLTVIGAIRQRRRSLYAVAAILGISYLWLFWQETGTSRLFLLMFLAPGLLLLARTSKRTALLVIPATLALAVVAFMFLSNSRYALRAGASLSDEVAVQRSAGLESLSSYAFRGGDFEAFEKGMLITQLIPNYEPPFYGGSFATLLIMPIPRSVWADKPAVSPTDAVVKWYPNTPDNFAITLIAEAYANWLWLGVVVVLTAFGFVSAKVMRRTLAQSHGLESWLVAGLYIAYVVLVTRGSFHTMTSYFLFSLFWLWFSRWVVRWFPRGRVAYRYRRSPA